MRAVPNTSSTLDNKLGPLFIIGSPRSGTSLLYYLTAAHPALAYPDLGLKLMLRNRWVRFLDWARRPVFADPAVHARFLPRSGETRYEPALRFLGLDPVLPQEGDFLWHDVAAGLGLAVEDIGVPELRAHPAAGRRIRARYQSLLARTGRPRFVDKAPAYTVLLETLRELFPDAHIVHIIRDGRAVVNSVAYAFKYRKRRGEWWGPKPPDWRNLQNLGPVERACHQWKGVVAEGRRARDLFPARYHEVRYEKLVAETRATMSALFTDTGLDPLAEDRYPEAMENRNYKWKKTGVESLGDPIWTDRPSIDPDEYPHLEVMRPLLESLGYVEPGARISPDPSRPRPEPTLGDPRPGSGD